MAKYKVGDKVFFEGVIIDTEANSTFPYRVKFSDGSDEIFREEILCFSNTYEDGYKDGYKKGKKEALMEVVNCEDAKYNQGLNDAWELAKKLYNLDCNTLEDIYGVDGGFYGLMKKYTAEEALAKIEAYEKSQQIEIGDIVRRISDDKEYLIITRENDKSAYNYGVISLTSMIIDRISYNRSDFEKTGRHIDIEHLLEQIRGNE